MVDLKSAAQIETMEHAGQIVARCLALVSKAVRPGVRLTALDALAEEYIRSQDAYPTFKGYHGFPASLCLSPNDMVVHGIPSPYRLHEGDILSIDCGATYDGFVGDSALTVPVGEISDETAALLDVTEECLRRGITACVPGNRLGDIGWAVQEHAEAHGYGVVKNLVGHGIGREMHMDPQVPNHGQPHRGMKLKAGMTLALEPMINLGTDDVFTAPDQWSIHTADGALSAHFEHTVAITHDGPRVLTARRDADGVPRADLALSVAGARG